MSLKELLKSRRSFLHDTGRMGAALAASNLLPVPITKLLAQSAKIKGKERLIVRSLQPDNLEPPVELLRSWLTPVDLFYVRNHLLTPEIKAEEWRLAVDGEVATPLRLSLDDLKKMPKVSLVVTLECAGNGRAFMVPQVAGVQWAKGGVSTAQWGGVRLADLLKRAGAKSTGKFVILDGGDKATDKTPDFVRQVPIAKAMDPDTLLAYEMNGEPLSQLHGSPLRAIVPGWEGAYAVKWLEQITVSEKEYDGFFVKTSYRYPAKRIAPGTKVDPKDMVPLTGMVVKSIISTPVDGSTEKAGNPIKVTGWAWAGESNIAKVEISLDNGATWLPARLGKERAKYAWRQFEFEWKAPEAGSFLVMSRATDDRGRVQPIAPQWNPSGYLWNVIDQVRVNVEA
jgi:sulfite oxidase